MASAFSLFARLLGDRLFVDRIDTHDTRRLLLISVHSTCFDRVFILYKRRGDRSTTQLDIARFIAGKCKQRMILILRNNNN